ncbi:MAG: outer membrane protein assembly factor BamE [Acidiferrobacterales bacterium]|jgi:outer membrane protein assembly factor BamE|nr:outer membrane protein assembly factor BamE [Acidiferrobacterales bacterium]
MKPRIIAIALLALLLQSCILYVPDVEQGNILTKEMIDKIKIGQSEQQVRFLLGSPLVQDAFHSDRWDYVYTLKKGRSKKVDQKRLTIIFNNGVVAKVVRKG